MKRSEIEQRLIMIREYKIRNARKSLWEFCKLLAPDFYIDGRTHLENLCDVLQRLYEGRLLNKNGEPYRRLILNLPP